MKTEPGTCLNLMIEVDEARLTQSDAMSEEINEYTNEWGESDRQKQVHGSDPSSYDGAFF